MVSYAPQDFLKANNINVQQQPMGNPAQQSAGFIPMNIEPLHQFERSALTRMAAPNTQASGGLQDAMSMLQKYRQDPSGVASQYTAPLASQYMTQAGGMMGRGGSDITFDEIMAARNPFAEQMKSSLSADAQRLVAAAKARQGLRGGQSYGDISLGRQLGDIDRGVLRQGTEIDFNTFDKALQMLQEGRGRSLQAGQGYGGLATGAQQIASDATANMFRTASGVADVGSSLGAQSERDIDRQLVAGQTIRGYNQGVNDIIGQQISQRAAYQPNQINDIIGMLNAYQSQTGTSGATPKSSTLEKVGGIAGAIGGIAGAFGFSDRRLKTNIQQIGTHTIAGKGDVGVYEFAYKGAPDRKHTGVMAQEVAFVMPEAVRADNDGVLTVDYNAIGASHLMGAV